MKVVRFVAHADPIPTPRLGLPLGGRLVDLQAAHFSMTGAPLPAFQDLAALKARRDAAELVRKVAEWATQQDAPGTSIPESAARVVEAAEV